jgi:lysylphosphatidylglycerol synthetase-like protein (DUF2156 family)
MKILGTKSIASILKWSTDVMYVLVWIFGVAIFCLFVWIYFLHGPEYDIHGWPIYAEVPLSAFDIQPLKPGIEVIEVQIERPVIGFVTERSWETILIQLGTVVFGFTILIAFFRHLRQITHSLTKSNPFTFENVRRFRRLAILTLMGIPFSIARSAAISLYVRSHFDIGSPRKHFGMWDLGFWGDIAEDSVLLFLFLAMIFLVMGEIIRIGLEYKEDSHSIV